MYIMSAIYRADGSYHNDNKTNVEQKQTKCKCKCNCENCAKCVKKDSKTVEKFGFFCKPWESKALGQCVW